MRNGEGTGVFKKFDYFGVRDAVPDPEDVEEKHCPEVHRQEASNRVQGDLVSAKSLFAFRIRVNIANGLPGDEWRYLR